MIPKGSLASYLTLLYTSKRISSGFAQSMVKDGETPLEPVEQDEWSLLVNASKRLQDDQERKKRQQQLKVKAEQRKVLDEQVAYLKAKRARETKSRTRS